MARGSAPVERGEPHAALPLAIGSEHDLLTVAGDGEVVHIEVRKQLLFPP
jgi:hypothetical protein